MLSLLQLKAISPNCKQYDSDLKQVLQNDESIKNKTRNNKINLKVNRILIV
jgi:hypothetical protein